jgi:protein-tyrosine phosphatase
VEVALPDGTFVLAQGRLDLVPSDRPRLPDFAVYLDERWHEDPEVTWPFLLIDWEDFGVPADEPAAFAAILDLHRRAESGELVEIACYRGVGRTGTVLSCLAVVAGVPLGDAVGWVRRHYHPQAVETPEQEQLIARFSRSLDKVRRETDDT